jgi:hypothetical protein
MPNWNVLAPDPCTFSVTLLKSSVVRNPKKKLGVSGVASVMVIVVA